MEPVQRKLPKRVIQVAGNPDFERVPHRDEFIANPRNNSFDWGVFPKIYSSGFVLEEGPIKLRYGQHVGPQRGYGLVHIWEARNFKSETLPNALSAIHLIGNLLDNIIQTGTEIYHEYGREGRVTLFKNKTGTLILEGRSDFYSIVTAWPKGVARGSKIGEYK